MATNKLTTIDRGSKGPKGESLRWEDATEETAHEQFCKWADVVREHPASVDRRKRNLLYASLYSNVAILGFGVNSYTRNSVGQGKISLNVIQNATDSLVSKVTKNRPRPRFTTVDADWDLIEKAENADKHVDGHFYNGGYYDETYPGVVLDTAVYGLGVSKSHEVEGDCLNERIYPFEMIFDFRECLYAKPKRIGQRKYYDKQEAFDLWRKDGDDDAEWNKKLEKAIDGGGDENDFGDFDRDESSEQIVIYEGYCAPTTKRAGKRIQCIRGLTLDLRDWKEHPYNFLRPKIQAMGMYGIGVAEKIWTVQAEINRIIRDIQSAMHLIAKPHWMVEASSNVLAASLNNDIATIIKYSGAVPPTVYTPQAMSADVYQHLQFLYQTAYEICGISQLSAQSQKPAGIDSAVGLRTYLNVETEYFNDFVRSAESLASKDAYKTAKVFASMKKPPKKLHVCTGSTEPVNWKPLDFDTIAVQIYPTSKLGDTPAGRREYALELSQYTEMGKFDLFELMEWEDTEAFAERALAPRRATEKDIMRILRGEKVVRDAIGDHEDAVKIASDAYCMAKNRGCVEKRLGVLRNYIKACRRFLSGPPPKAPLPGELPPGAPVGPGGVPPMGPEGMPPMDPMMPPPEELPPGEPMPEMLPPEAA